MLYRGGTEPYGREGRKSDGKRSGDGNEVEDWDGNGGGDENREEYGEKREPGNLQRDIRGWAENTREEMTPTCNQQPQSQDPTPQRGRLIMRGGRAQG